MLDIKFIRENPDLLKETVKNRNMQADIDGLLKLETERRRLLSEVELLKCERNTASTQIGKLIAEKKDVQDKKERMKQVSQKIKEIDAKVGEISKKLAEIMLTIPNITHSSLPIGPDPQANKLIKEWGRMPKFNFEPLTHIELAEHLGIIDFQRAAKISGSNFVLYKGAGARLERALINFMLDLHTKKHGYTEIFPPFLVNRVSMTATGQLPKLEADMYCLKDDDLFLIPTAEVPVTNIHRNEILNEEQLPVCYTAYTACFRREAGSYGKDTKGLVRIHQFDKVELVKFVKPEDSYDELESLLEDAEEVLRLLELPYRITLLSTEGISFAASKCYDINAWAAGSKAYLEVSSCSNFTDFQARRANIKYKRTTAQAGRPEYVHTLNGSGIALARTVIALLENHQQPNGTVRIPKALRRYMDGQKKIG